MANGGSGDRPVGEFGAALVQLVFSLTFPLVLITLCCVSFLLSAALHAPELSLWSNLAGAAFDYAGSNIWAGIGLAVFVLAALPLAWVAFREQQLQISSTLKSWVMTVVAFGGMFWLRTAWPDDDSGWQRLVYGFILLFGWVSLIEAALGTWGIRAHIRASRPVPAQRPQQEPHGGGDQRRRPDDPETI